MNVEIPEKLLAQCGTCGETFVKLAPSQRFCSAICRSAGDDPKMVEIIRAGSKAVKEKRDRAKLDENLK